MIDYEPSTVDYPCLLIDLTSPWIALSIITNPYFLKLWPDWPPWGGGEPLIDRHSMIYDLVCFHDIVRSHFSCFILFDLDLHIRSVVVASFLVTLFPCYFIFTINPKHVTQTKMEMGIKDNWKLVQVKVEIFDKWGWDLLDPKGILTFESQFLIWEFFKLNK